VRRRFVAASSWLMDVHTVGDRVFFGVATVNMFLLANKIMLTSLDEYFSATVLNGRVLHGNLLHSTLGHCDFLSTNISQGSVAMHLRCGGIFNDCFARNLLLSP